MIDSNFCLVTMIALTCAPCLLESDATFPERLRGGGRKRVDLSKNLQPSMLKSRLVQRSIKWLAHELDSGSDYSEIDAGYSLNDSLGEDRKSSALPAISPHHIPSPGDVCAPDRTGCAAAPASPMPAGPDLDLASGRAALRRGAARLARIDLSLPADGDDEFDSSSSSSSLTQRIGQSPPAAVSPRPQASQTAGPAPAVAAAAVAAAAFPTASGT